MNRLQKKQIRKEKAQNPNCKLTQTPNYWTEQEDELLKQKSIEYKAKNWKLISQYFTDRSPQACSFRWKKIKGEQYSNLEDKFTKEQDEILVELVSKHGQKWHFLEQFFKNKTNKQIRERYLNKLRPEILKSKFTEEEDYQLFKLWQQYGNHWKQFGQLLNRSENNIKNRFYSCIQKKIPVLIEKISEIENENYLQEISNQIEEEQQQKSFQFINPDQFFAKPEEVQSQQYY